MKTEELIKKQKIYIKKDQYDNFKSQKNIKILSKTVCAASRYLKNNEDKLIITYNLYNPIDYEDLVAKLIEEKYSINDQIAIIRQKDLKVDEYNEFYNFCEKCKVLAKNYVNERDNINYGKEDINKK